MTKDTFEKLTSISNLLGWRNLKKIQHEREDTSETIVWYESGDVFCKKHSPAMQINSQPFGQERFFAACVFAIRYRLCSGWHVFDLHAKNFENEIERLHNWLDYDWFQTSERRSEYRKLYPECIGFTWRKIRESGVPGQFIDPLDE